MGNNKWGITLTLNTKRVFKNNLKLFLEIPINGVVTLIKAKRQNGSSYESNKRHESINNTDSTHSYNSEILTIYIHSKLINIHTN